MRLSMLSVDILINEHKLILRAVEIIKKETQRIESNNNIDPNFITTAVDFFRTYADRFHHGKEEGILFSQLSQKKMRKTDKKIMTELMAEHAIARRTVNALENAKIQYIFSKKDNLAKILDSLDALIELYPMHIEKEDKHFFYPSMDYFTEIEQDQMMANFVTFNQEFTDKRYDQIFRAIE
jgi:hemerythrin-like domain-containing protein